jgi:hypothetical protein
MTERRLDRVTFAGSRDATTVVISRRSRQALLDRLRAAGGADDVIDAIRAVGAARPVVLTKAQKRRLLEVCEAWLSEVNVIFDLRNALIDERDRGDLDEDEAQDAERASGDQVRNAAQPARLGPR